MFDSACSPELKPVAVDEFAPLGRFPMSPCFGGWHIKRGERSQRFLVFWTMQENIKYQKTYVPGSLVSGLLIIAASSASLTRNDLEGLPNKMEHKRPIIDVVPPPFFLMHSSINTNAFPALFLFSSFIPFVSKCRRQKYMKKTTVVFGVVTFIPLYPLRSFPSSKSQWNIKTCCLQMTAIMKKVSEYRTRWKRLAHSC